MSLKKHVYQNKIAKAFTLLSVSPFYPAMPSTLELKSYTGVECGTDPFIERAPSCGIELYSNLQSSACSAIQEAKADPSCGVLEYIKAASASCGVAAYSSGSSAQVCGNDEYETTFSNSISIASCPPKLDGGFGNVTETKRYSTSKRDATVDGAQFTKHTDFVVCKGFKPKVCSHPNFGVLGYNTCAHSDHGVAQWNICNVVIGYQQCRHESHGVELYNSCETSRTNRTCQVYLDPTELGVYIPTQRDNVDFKVTNVLNWAATVFKVRKDAHKLGCLVKEIVFDPSLTGGLLISSDTIDKIKLTYKSIAYKEFDLVDFDGSTCESTLQKVKKIICLPTDESSVCSALSGFKSAVVDLEDTQNELVMLLEDVVVKGNAASLTEIGNMHTSVKTTLATVNKP